MWGAKWYEQQVAQVVLGGELGMEGWGLMVPRGFKKGVSSMKYDEYIFG